MTCGQVLDIIDAEGVADEIRARREAARAHARECAPCARAFAAAQELATGLAGIAYPAPPRDFSGSVMARIAAEASSAAAVRVTSWRAAAASGARIEWATLGSVAVLLALALYASSIRGWPVSQMGMVRGSYADVVESLSTPSRAWPLAVALACVVLILRIPLGSRKT